MSGCGGWACPASSNRRSTASDRANSIRLMITTPDPGENRGEESHDRNESQHAEYDRSPCKVRREEATISDKRNAARQYKGRKPDRERIEAPAVKRVERLQRLVRELGGLGGLGERSVNQRLHGKTCGRDHRSRQCDVPRGAQRDAGA